MLEATLRREIHEEVGIAVDPEMEYAESKSFVADGGTAVVDVVFLCRYKSGSVGVTDPGEVASVAWMTAEDVARDPLAPQWTRRSIGLAEARRLGLRR